MSGVWGQSIARGSVLGLVLLISTQASALVLGGGGGLLDSDKNQYHPEAPQGTVAIEGQGKARLRFEYQGSRTNLERFTIGIFDFSQMTAGVLDPDFQFQALRADSAIIFHESGQALDTTVFEIDAYDDSQFGLFFIEDGTVADFSRGLNLIDPIFSLSGAPGSQQIELVEGALKGATVFSVASSANGGSTLLGGGNTKEDLFMVIVSGHLGVLLDPAADPPSPPVIPEPTTWILVGSGVALLGGWRRRRASRALSSPGPCATSVTKSTP